jgi:hypothetical protein
MGELNLNPSEEVAEQFAESYNERCPVQGRGLGEEVKKLLMQ